MNIEKFRTIAKDPQAYLTAQKEQQKYRYCGYTCVYIPEALVHAAGFIPVRLFGFAKRLKKAEKHIPSNSCEFARNLLETIDAKASKYCDFFVFSHCCDTLEVLYEVAPRMAEIKQFTFHVPTQFHDSSAITYTNSEIIRLQNYLQEQFSISVTEEALLNSWTIYAKHYRLMQQLYEIRSLNTNLLSGSDTIAISLAANYMPMEEHNALLENILHQLKSAPGRPTQDKRIFLSGTVNANLQTIELIEKSGCLIVDDDLCESYRHIPAAIDDNFVYPASLSRIITTKFCPVKIDQQKTYSDIVLNRMKRARAEGVIFMFFPACDAQFIEYAAVKKRLKEEQIKSLLLEIVATSHNQGQLQTRIEAFSESLI